MEPTERSSITFLDLPLEIQKEILFQCAQSDLICVALASRHFRDLAASILYREFNIIFPDDEEVLLDKPIDGLAGGLDTLTTSDYNYAQHLREISMDTLSLGMKGEMSYQPYLYRASCGKFFNTLLYLTLKKAKKLETFKWNIRVELTRQVYRELHRMGSLKNLHLRMQAGESYYMPPPPLPAAPIPTAAEVWTPDHWSGPPPAMPSTVSLPLTVNLPPLPGPPPALVPPSKKLPKSRAARKDSFFKEPPTVSGFAKLQSLAVLDIDDLDISTELAACVKNSSRTLKRLSLSFSSSLATEARRPPHDSDPDDSDIDEEFTVNGHGHHHHHHNHESTSAAKVFRAQEERKVQESFLARIFEVEASPSVANLATAASDDKGSPSGTADGPSKSQETPATDTNSLELVRQFLHAVSSNFTTLSSGTQERASAHRTLLNVLEKAALEYMGATGLESLGITSENVSQALAVENEAIGNGPGGVGDDVDLEQSDAAKDLTGISNCAEPLELQSPKRDDPFAHGSSSLPKSGNSEERLRSKHVFYVRQMETLSNRLSELRIEGNDQDASEIDSLVGQLAQAEHDTRQIEHQLQSKVPDGQQEPLDAGHDVRDYLKQTRGHSLESLSIYLIPIKASVLSRAVDLRCLKQLTLLNVGNQAAIWAALTKENQHSPLPLRSVFTDHVSEALLTCLSQLPALHDLFMVEQSTKNKPESLAPRTTVTIEQIKKMVLQKHMRTLRRLMIKDDSHGSRKWDITDKLMKLICFGGERLEELAICLNISAVHTMIQNISQLKQLRAFHILRFKNNDTCVWVMREIVKFVIDSLAHVPESKLEYVGMEDDRVDRILRFSQTDMNLFREERRRARNKKGKARAPIAFVPSPPYNAGYSSTNSVLLSSTSDTESGSDEDFDCDPKFKAVGPLRFSDVWGVKIFEKEILEARL
ncbi:uncharacterized protein J7T54_003269 [Emericellopsis cladophorae]|uniref:F-box domain-containing protein n=1 Tax=Emericellopsis cladophorae TaxID=2686198 RepID=A0A9Q0BD77_9HYPO|nr:uncharacterized protein J7T54_003269 [Emericellopsis cladophorae]KAI6781102.1 hypothetical protein J7T54_003269 [Emericellopsis cladophorae]